MGRSKAELYIDYVSDRLSIMEHSFDVNEKLRNLFKKDLSDSEIESQYSKITEDLFSNDPEPLSRRNTAYYVWGLLKNLVTKWEKRRVFGMLDTLDGDTNGFLEIKMEFYKLAQKYEVAPILNSRYLDPIRPKM